MSKDEMSKFREKHLFDQINILKTIYFNICRLYQYLKISQK